MPLHRGASQSQQGQLCLWIICLLVLAAVGSGDQSCDADLDLTADPAGTDAAPSATQHARSQRDQRNTGSSFVASVTLTNGGGDELRGALLSVVKWVDACIVLDTGITDNTVEVAKLAAGDKLLLQKLPWPGSFAEARNAALDAAAAVGAQWAIMLDTDERIHCSLATTGAVDDEACSGLLSLLANSSAAMISMLHASATYHKPRIFRMPRAGSFQGRTHEWFALQPGAMQHTLDGSTVFAELPKDARGVQAKAARDIQLLGQETAAAPQEQRWWYYLGDAYEISGDCNAAVKAWGTCAGISSGWAEEGAWCMYRAAACHARSRDWDAALQALARGMTRHPGLPELPWYAGWVCYQAGRYKEATAWSHMSMALGCNEGLCVDRIGFSHPPGKYEGPYDVLKWALKALGDEAGAAAAEVKEQKALAARKALGAK
ncbi:hypothetical protein COO60DRAFT_1703697 [Scenedesmus sp. NREL 46B-D3]|nr:hypothetical protein COO60DRAFT_1703697 [Scenedesmus sp. NREL 46B-D3]